MDKITDELLLDSLKCCEADFNTLADYYKHLLQNKVELSIEELRARITQLYRDGFVGNEPTGDGVNMYYLIFCPDKFSCPVKFPDNVSGKV